MKTIQFLKIIIAVAVITGCLLLQIYGMNIADAQLPASIEVPDTGKVYLVTPDETLEFPGETVLVVASPQDGKRVDCPECPECPDAPATQYDPVKLEALLVSIESTYFWHPTNKAVQGIYKRFNDLVEPERALWAPTTE